MGLLPHSYLITLKTKNKMELNLIENGINHSLKFNPIIGENSTKNNVTDKQIKIYLVNALKNKLKYDINQLENAINKNYKIYAYGNENYFCWNDEKNNRCHFHLNDFKSMQRLIRSIQHHRNFDFDWYCEKCDEEDKCLLAAAILVADFIPMNYKNDILAGLILIKSYEDFD